MASKNWSKPTRYLIFVLLLAGALWFIIAARNMFSALAIAALLAFILNPLVTLVNMHAKVSRNWTVLLVYLLSLAGLVALGIIFIPVIPEQTGRLANELQIILEQIQNEYLERPITLLNYEISLGPLLPDFTEITSENIIRPDIILSAIQATTTNVGWLLVILVTTFYLLQDWDRLREWLFSWAPEAYAGDARRLYEEIRWVWNRYFRGQLRLSIIIGILTGLGSAAIGLPGAIIFGIAAGVFDVLLSVGPFLVMAVAFLVALFAGSTFLPVSNFIFALLVLAVHGGIQSLENIWLRPRIMGHSLKMHPAIVFIAIISSLALAGVLMALIIIPVIGSAAVIIRYLYCKIFEIDPWEKATPVFAEIQTAEQPSERPSAQHPLSPLLPAARKKNAEEPKET